MEPMASRAFYDAGSGIALAHVRHRFRPFTVAALAAVLALVATAPAVRGAETSAPTIVSLTERAERRLPRDLLAADLAVTASSSDPRKLQDEINRRMTAALARARSVPNVTLSTTGYTLNEVHPEHAPSHWEGRQALHLESKDQAALLALVGGLQTDGLTIARLSAGVSPAAERAAEDELTAEALKLVAARAEHIAVALDMRVAGYRSLHIGNAAVPPAPMRAFLGAAPAPAAVAAPVAEPGEATVSLSVEAEIELVPRQ
ncbi:MAG TPA: SIMPL domain-containing protein [Stellaceae bacterium]|nr:SIMPL domain-containing protein [Stellaceae bacterium]